MGLIWLVVLLVLLAILVYLFINFGIINVDPQFIAIRRNVLTGGLKELKPGLSFFVPGVFEDFRLVDCRQVILDPEPLTVTSRDGQPVTVDYQITLWVDGFFGEDKIEKALDGKEKIIAKKGGIKGDQAIKAATRIGEQTGIQVTTPQERFKKDIEAIGLKESNVSIQNMIASYMLEDLIGKKDALPVLCPNCGCKIESEKDTCPDDKCPKHGKKVPAGFFERLSWSAGISLNDSLDDKYGLGCFLKIRNVRYPEDYEKAQRAQKIAEMQGEATKKRLEKEADGFEGMIEKTKANPNVVVLAGKAMELLIETLAGKKK
ncbi:MAG: SPFH domain-containing protein [Candidatus Portnoybacteria bacterium]|nr:SPFH domain-containing protein [Candidatus Portnoybacteria bacterium]